MKSMHCSYDSHYRLKQLHRFLIPKYNLHCDFSKSNYSVMLKFKIVSSNFFLYASQWLLCFLSILQSPDETPENESLSKVDCFMVAVGDDKETVYSKSISLHVSLDFHIFVFSLQQQIITVIIIKKILVVKWRSFLLLLLLVCTPCSSPNSSLIAFYFIFMCVRTCLPDHIELAIWIWIKWYNLCIHSWYRILSVQ